MFLQLYLDAGLVSVEGRGEDAAAPTAKVSDVAEAQRFLRKGSAGPSPEL